MNVVIDTNVLLSALLKAGTPPAEVISDLFSGQLVALYNQEILDEYREVLARPKHKISSAKSEVILDFIVSDGIHVPNARFAGQLPDVDDQPFADVAFSGGADLLITGNTKHFPRGPPLRVVTPREWLNIKKSMSLLRAFGLDESAALEPNDPFTVARACKRCGTIRAEEILGMTPLAQPQQLPFPCDETRPEGKCGGEVWSYDDNDLGRQQARAMGIPTSS